MAASPTGRAGPGPGAAGTDWRRADIETMTETEQMTVIGWTLLVFLVTGFCLGFTVGKFT